MSARLSEIPGTTRDTVEDDCYLGGIPVRLVDTAGLRQTGDKIEQIGIERSLKALENADCAAKFRMPVWDSPTTTGNYSRPKFSLRPSKKPLWSGIRFSGNAPRLASGI